MAPTAHRTLLRHELSRTDARSIVTIARLMLSDAHASKASDIHIDPAPDATRVRLRIDGELSDSYAIPAAFHNELVSRLKILSRLRIDEHFSPQDGRFTFAVPDTDIRFDVRISILPTQFGESVVLRLLIPPSEGTSFAGLGLQEDQLVDVEQMLHSSHGLVLIVGPTGSGKTTTLYALIRALAQANRSIISIEDPIEYSVPGVRQVQVQPNYGLTFAEGLRAILRQDPDVIVVGEIRDAETASLAVNAAHTGHLVLSTVHAVNADGMFARFKELGIARARFQSIHILVVAQTLVRNPGREGRRGEFTLLYA